MNYVKVAKTTDLPEGGKIKISLDNKDILLVNIRNTFFAVDNKCTHMGGSLVEGKLEEQHIVCPRHGSIFDVTNGKVVAAGQLFFMKVKVADLRSYPVLVEGEDISIRLD